MFSTIIWVSLLAPAPADPASPAKKELFAKEDWYKSEKSKEQDFIGILKYSPRAKGVVGFGRFNPYQLLLTPEKDMREVYVGGKEDILKEYAGKKVKITGKPVDMEVEGRNHREIWPARIEVLPDDKPKGLPANPAKDPFNAVALALAPNEREVKVPTIVAKHSSRIGTQQGVEPVQGVIRTAEELANKTGASMGEAANIFKLNQRTIDFKTKMIVVVSAGTKRTGGYSVEVTSLEINKDKELVVKWKLNSPAPGQPVTQALTHPAQTILIDRFEGKVVFDPALPKADKK